MRVYVPATMKDLRAESLSVRPIHYVSPLLREREGDEDEEVLEAYAFYAAADSALLRLARGVEHDVLVADTTRSANGSAESGKGEPDPLLRIVVSAELAPSFVAAVSEAALHPSVGVLTQPCPWDAVVAIHCDEPTVAPLVEQALQGAEEAVAALAEADLLWYDASERALLLDEFSR